MEGITIDEIIVILPFHKIGIALLLPNFIIDFTDSSRKENNLFFPHYYNQYLNTKYFHLQKYYYLLKINFVGCSNSDQYLRTSFLQS